MIAESTMTCFTKGTLSQSGSSTAAIAGPWLRVSRVEPTSQKLAGACLEFARIGSRPISVVKPNLPQRKSVLEVNIVVFPASLWVASNMADSR